MSIRHPIIAVTGSSGAGTTTVMKSFAHIFRREGIKAQVIEGDSFHRYNRVEMRERVDAADSGRGPRDQPFRAGSQPAGRAGRHVRRIRRHRRRQAAPLRPRCRRGQGTRQRAGHVHALAGDAPDSDLLFYEGLHGGYVGGDVDVAAARGSAGRRGADRQPGVDPETASRPPPARLQRRMRWSTPSCGACPTT